MSELEQNLLNELDGFDFDISHDKDHIRNVLKNARLLHNIYGGNTRILFAAVILHDLGRSNFNLHGEESRVRSVDLATPILKRNSFSPDEIKEVHQVILDHDQPDKTPETLEGKILKDADYLDGFGARGILRTIIWTVKSGGSLEDIIYRLRVKMPQRIDGLEFRESREIALKEYEFVENFLERLGITKPSS